MSSSAPATVQHRGPPRRARPLRVLIEGGPLPAGVRSVLTDAGIQVKLRPAGPGRWWRGCDAVLVLEREAEPVLDELRADTGIGLGAAVIVLCDPSREARAMSLVDSGAADYVLMDRPARLPLTISAARDRARAAKQAHNLELALNVGQEVLRRGFDGSTSALIVVDKDGRISQWNRPAERDLGWREEEVSGCSVVELLTSGEEGERLASAIARARVAKTPDEERRTLMVRTRGGQILRREMRVIRMSSGADSVIVSLAEFAERWRLELLKERKIGLLSALTAEDSAVLPGVLEQLALSLDANEARLWEAGARGELRLGSRWTGPNAAAPAGLELPAVPPLVEQACATGKMAVADSGGDHGCADEPSFRMAIPLVHGPQLLGAVEVRGPTTPGLDDHLMVHVMLVAGHVAAYLARRRSEMDFARSLEELQRLERERRRLMHLLVDAHEDERRAIAADIHDDPLQSLAAVALRLHTLRRRVNDPAALRTLDQVEDMVRTTVGRLRGLMFNLRPPALDRGDLVGALRERLQQVGDETGLEYRLTASEPVGLSPDLRVALYRIAQEAVANIVRHASASCVEVTLEEQGAGVLLRVADNGVGIQGGDPAGRPAHMGMHSMRERAELAGGWLRIDPSEVGGTVVNAWMPMQRGEPAGGEAA